MIPSEGKQLIALLFNEGEQVCVSHDGYGYSSVSLDSLNYEVLELISPNQEIKDKTIKTDEIRLISLNPVNGFRRDENCTSYRSFLVECDDGPLPEQLKYVNEMKMPYSACVFSGGKSLHFAITLDKDFAGYEIYYYYATWILNVMSKADQNTKNPTRSIRMAGALRETGRKQHLVEMKCRISFDELNAWLSQYDGFKPTGFFSKKKEGERSEIPLSDRVVPWWVTKELKEGLDISKGRNRRWFQIASEFGRVGYDEEETVDILDSYFQPEYNFKRPEWVTTVRSGVRNGQQKGDNE